MKSIKLYLKHASYIGKHCEETVNITCDFTPPPCKNGSCQDLNEQDRRPKNLSDNGFDFFKCNCDPGFKGNRCDTPTNECDPNPCEHATNCTGNKLYINLRNSKFHTLYQND